MDSVVHFEIPADNPKRAQKFYSTVFDWKINNMPDMGYALLGTTEVDKNQMPTKPGAINGGMLKRQAPVKSVVITINVASIDDAAKKIVKQGGKVVRKKSKVGDMGYAAYFKDTEGNVMGLWQNKM
ncbi:MAG TPA: VOC family protein [Nitrososphaerales archaeon]